MNVGQILETHLGLAAKGLGEKINLMLEEQRKVAELRKFLHEIYNEIGGRQENLDDLSDQEVLDLANNRARACRWRPRCSTVPGARDQGHAEAGRSAGKRPDAAVRRPYR